MIAFESVVVGASLPAQSFTVTREDLVRYAGASGDFNRIHWDENVAVEVGLPGVIAHGMLTMARTIRVVTDWTGDPGSVLDYSVRFTRPVVVPRSGAATIEVSGVVKSTDPLARTATIALSTIFAGQTVLAKARAVVRLA